MKLTGELIGDDLVDQDINEAVRRAERLPQAMDGGAEKIVNRSINIARMKGLVATGAGISGIIFETEREDRLIGWASRPNFHLYFHEIGTYKDYPRPHVRPAADQMENEVLDDIERTIIGD